MTRRFAGARRSRSGGSSAISVMGVQGFTTSNHYSSANPGGSAGTDTGFWFGVLYRVDSQSVASDNRNLFCRSSGVANGWQIRTTALNTNLAIRVTNGAASAVTINSTITAGDVGKMLLAIGVHTGSNFQGYRARAQIGSDTPITGYTTYSGRTALGVLSTLSSQAADGVTIFGAASGHAVPSLAEIQALYDSVKAAGDMQSIAGKTDHLWSVKRSQAGSAPATLTNQVGADNLTLGGSLTLVTTASPQWGW